MAIPNTTNQWWVMYNHWASATFGTEPIISTEALSDIITESSIEIIIE